MDERSVLSRLVKIARKTLLLSNHLGSIGYDNNPYADIYGDAADAIYYMLGERTNNFCESITYMVLTSEKITDAQRVDILLNQYTKRFASA